MGQKHPPTDRFAEFLLFSKLWIGKLPQIRSTIGTFSPTGRRAPVNSTGDPVLPPQELEQSQRWSWSPRSIETAVCCGVGRTIWDGRAHVRTVLYMAALTASRRNPAIKDYFTWLQMASNTPNVALVACMRKRLVIVNAMLKHRVPWGTVVTHTPLKPNTVVIKYAAQHSTVLAAKSSNLILGICTFIGSGVGHPIRH